VFVLKGVTVFEVGRAQGSHVRVTDEGVAMNHCRLFRKGDEFTLYALSDSKPTLVNGSTARKVVLQNGDRITLGQTELLFELVSPDEVDRVESLPPARFVDAPAGAGAEAPGTGTREKQSSPPDAEDEQDTVAAKAESSKEQPAGPKIPASLVVMDGENRGAVFRLFGKKKFKIGRASAADVHLTDAKISRDHCLIQHKDGHFVLVDLESANGTIVNGERIRKTVLRNNDFLRLGFTVLKFQDAR
jgi:pSer/pThr/pTyr-binding forkhead associated (FHA) protein